MPESDARSELSPTGSGCGWGQEGGGGNGKVGDGGGGGRGNDKETGRRRIRGTEGLERLSAARLFGVGSELNLSD